MVLGSYARNGDWRSQVTAVARITRNSSLPFVWLADFNDDPSTLRQEPWCDWLAAEVIVPDKQITCHMGSGSLIDYGICPYIAEFTVVTDVPWEPHDGLRLRLRRHPRSVMTLGKAEISAEHGQTVTISWTEALAMAREQANRTHTGQSSTSKAQQKLVGQLGTQALSDALGSRLAIWAHATESQALTRLGMPVGHEAHSYRGRAQAPEFVLRPLMSRPRLVAESLQMPGGYGATARLWATCRALGAKLRAAMKRNANEAEICVMRARIVALALRSSSGLRSAWEASAVAADMAAGLFAILTASSPVSTIDAVEQAIGAF